MLILGAAIYRVPAEQLDPLDAGAVVNNLTVSANIKKDFSVADNDNLLMDISYFYDKPSEELVETYEQYNTAVSEGNTASGMAAYFKLASIITDHTELIADIVNDKDYYNLYVTDEIVKAAATHAYKRDEGNAEAFELFDAYLGAESNATQPGVTDLDSTYHKRSNIRWLRSAAHSIKKNGMGVVQGIIGNAAWDYYKSSPRSSCGSSDGKSACLSWTDAINDFSHAAARPFCDDAIGLWYNDYVTLSVKSQDYLQLASRGASNMLFTFRLSHDI